MKQAHQYEAPAFEYEIEYTKFGYRSNSETKQQLSVFSSPHTSKHNATVKNWEVDCIYSSSAVGSPILPTSWMFSSPHSLLPHMVFTLVPWIQLYVFSFVSVGTLNSSHL